MPPILHPSDASSSLVRWTHCVSRPLGCLPESDSAWHTASTVRPYWDDNYLNSRHDQHSWVMDEKDPA